MDINYFNAVIGNPPYNEDPNKSNDPHMKPIYQIGFINILNYLIYYYSLLHQNGLLLKINY